ncbi:MAG: hydrogenase maturation protease [Roseiarcus sp.]|jgi:hydrogenase maturation protease
MAAGGKILVLGLGNALRGDDGVGVDVVDALRRGGAEARRDVSVSARDGGTLGLALLPEIESAWALIIVDAARFGGAPGELRVFEGAAMDAQVGRARSSVHEVALADLVGAASLTGHLPARRALVGVAPESTDWGLAPSAAVAAAVPAACAAIEGLLARWTAPTPPAV